MNPPSLPEFDLGAYAKAAKAVGLTKNASQAIFQQVGEWALGIRKLETLSPAAQKVATLLDPKTFVKSAPATPES